MTEAENHFQPFLLILREEIRNFLTAVQDNFSWTVLLLEISNLAFKTSFFRKNPLHIKQ